MRLLNSYPEAQQPDWKKHLHKQTDHSSAKPCLNDNEYR